MVLSSGEVRTRAWVVCTRGAACMGITVPRQDQGHRRLCTWPKGIPRTRRRCTVRTWTEPCPPLVTARNGPARHDGAQGTLPPHFVPPLRSQAGPTARPGANVCGAGKNLSRRYPFRYGFGPRFFPRPSNPGTPHAATPDAESIRPIILGIIRGRVLQD